nr:histidinol-phosphate transaminase [Bacillota bacterium]
REHENLILLRTFSKIYGLAGFRIGYGIAAPAVIDALNRVREPFNTSFVAQEAALAALDDQAFVEACVQQNEKGKQQLYEGFARLGLRHYETHGNFILVDVGRPAGPVFEALLRQGVIVRSGEALGFPTALRVTIGDEAQNCRVLEALAAALVEA